ncbi:hypothetical protein D3C87_1753190 [compost metagenome]
MAFQIGQQADPVRIVTQQPTVRQHLERIDRSGQRGTLAQFRRSLVGMLFKRYCDVRPLTTSVNERLQRRFETVQRCQHRTIGMFYASLSGKQRMNAR